MSKTKFNSIFEDGILNTNFFNGRLLTADDLKTEQQANRQHHSQLGRAVGEGVVSGLEVVLPGGALSGGCTVRISSGLAINRTGQTIALNADAVEVRMVEEQETVKADEGRFTDCKVKSEMITGTGLYILLISPASDFIERAPMSGPGGNGRITGCGKRYEVEGVQFRTVKLDDGLTDDTRAALNELKTGTDAASVSMMRNIAAHACLGTEDKEAFVKDPFNFADQVAYGAIDKLRAIGDSKNSISDYDVPLAILYLTADGIRFIDMWSVRRRTHSRLTSSMRPLLANQRRIAEADACFLQFHDCISNMTENIAGQSELASVKAASNFRFLPSAGFLPVNEFDCKKGFDYRKFFSDITYRKPVFIEGSVVESLIRNSLSYPPLYVNTKRFIWLYFVRENIEEVKKNKPDPPQCYLVFTSGHMAYQGNARFDANCWDYANFAEV